MTLSVTSYPQSTSSPRVMITSWKTAIVAAAPHAAPLKRIQM